MSSSPENLRPGTPSGIRVRIAASRTLDAGAADAPPSAWLYFMGLAVTATGLYAVNYNLEDTGFAIATFSLTFVGYLTSFVLRRRRVSFRGMQGPLLACMALIAALGVVTGQTPSWLGVSSAANVPSAEIEVVIAWLAVLLAFVLSSDALVLFACVPAMSLLALASTNTPDSEIQVAYMAFIAAATFLIVHENFLRTRRAVGAVGLQAGDRFFGGQLALALVCVLATFIAANIVAVPMRAMGLGLSQAGAISALNRTLSPYRGKGGLGGGGRGSYELATGPTVSSDAKLLVIQAGPAGLYWRGSTYDFYTGHSFENALHASRAVPLQDVEESRPKFIGEQVETAGTHGPRYSSFRMPQSDFDVSPAEMQGSTVVRQHVRIVGGDFMELYSAGEPLKARTPYMSVNWSPCESLSTDAILPIGTEYDIVSAVTSTDPRVLQEAAAPIPPAIASAYLQLTALGRDESPRVRTLAEQTTQGLPMLYARVRALQAVVAHRCKYNLRCAAAPRDRDVVDYFLFDLQEGYCDSFAAALTMLCRYDGIPARMASGFITGDSEGGAFVVRDKDRHMWTEVYFPGVGWVPFDATEGSQDITPVGDDASSRVNVLVTWFRSQGWGPRAAGLALIVLFAYLIKTELLPRIPRLSRRRDPQHARMEAVVAAYAAACTALSRRGLRRRVTDTPDEFMARVASRHGAASPDVALAFQRLTDNHARCCYGPAAPGDRDIREAALALAALRAALREVRGTLGDTPERPRRRIRTLRPSETGQ